MTHMTTSRVIPSEIAKGNWRYVCCVPTGVSTMCFHVWCIYIPVYSDEACRYCCNQLLLRKALGIQVSPGLSCKMVNIDPLVSLDLLALVDLCQEKDAVPLNDRNRTCCTCRVSLDAVFLCQAKAPMCFLKVKCLS